jgi:UDP-N-acetylmuramoyl-tripeptide--D-alanyl-D-alanine ligase
MKSFLKSLLIKILIIESKIILKKYKPSIITVTGSVGKTSTKDAIYTVLEKTGHIRKSDKSFNSEIGVPLTILGCPNGWDDPAIWLRNMLKGLELIMFNSKYPECLVLEIGADHPGDIQKMASWLKSDIVVITKVSEVPVHVEFFKSPEEVFQEKFSLTKSLKDSGVLIISADDRKLFNESLKIKQKVMTFSIDNLSTVAATEIELEPSFGMVFKIKHDDKKYTIKIEKVIGNQQIYPIIAAITVGLARSLTIDQMIESLKNHVPPRGRMNILSGLNGSTIIDDTYNSSPDALSEALSTLSKVNVTGRKIAVLGDMMELGKFSFDEHKKAGEKAKVSCNILITVGPRSKQMAENDIHFNSSIETGEYLKTIVQKGDIVLVKGSQFIRLERATKAILAEPDRAKDLLVRQDAEWLAKK